VGGSNTGFQGAPADYSGSCLDPNGMHHIQLSLGLQHAMGPNPCLFEVEVILTSNTAWEWGSIQVFGRPEAAG